MRQDPSPSYVCARQGLREEGALAQHVHQGALGTGERVVLRTGLSEKNLPITALRAHLLSGRQTRPRCLQHPWVAGKN